MLVEIHLKPVPHYQKFMWRYAPNVIHSILERKNWLIVLAVLNGSEENIAKSRNLDILFYEIQSAAIGDFKHH